MDNPTRDCDQANDGPPMPTEAALLVMMEQSDRDRRTSPGVPLADVVAKIEQEVVEFLKKE